MGIEQLNSAARAAGFAMATCEDQFDNVSTAAEPAATHWTPGQAVMVREPAGARADWVRVLVGLFGRRAPVSPT